MRYRVALMWCGEEIDKILLVGVDTKAYLLKSVSEVTPLDEVRGKCWKNFFSHIFFGFREEAGNRSGEKFFSREERIETEVPVTS
jgi:hypothetical protein